MLLAVDIGNTNIVFGHFKGNKLVSKSRILTGAKIKVKSPILKVNKILIASVVPDLNKIVSGKLQNIYKVKPLFLRWQDIDINITLRNKGQIGIDRLVNAFAAKKIYGYPAIIIDFGTATTFCALDRQGKYLGGAITSGLAISRDILHNRTAKLPFIKIEKPKNAIGKDTKEAMRSGLYFGYIDMVNGMIKRFKDKLGKNAKVVATGGLAKLIASGTDKIDVVDQDLTLKGLELIYYENLGARH